MPTVTVPGSNHPTVTLTYDTDANALLALHVAGAIADGIAANKIFTADNASGPLPAVPPGDTGEFIQSKAGTTLLPAHYDFVVDSAKTANIFGNGDAHEAVLVGSGDLKFFAASGSGSIIAGGGKNLISIASTDHGPWLIAMGNGDDSILALGSGNDTISVGTGKDRIQLGSGSTFLTMGGADTVLAAGGSETVDASASTGGDVIFANTSKLFFVAGGSASVFGGGGSVTVFGGTGKQLFEGGSAGDNFLQAGDGRATLFGGGDGDQLSAFGNKAQALHAASGNETLSGAFAGGRDTFYGGSGSDQIIGGAGKNTFVAGSGTATVTASPGSMNVFEFMKKVGGGSELVQGLTDDSQVHIKLLGFNREEIRDALASQTVKDGSVTITLSDHSTVTFQNVGLLGRGNFSIGGDPGGNDDHMGGHRDHHGDHGDH